MVCVAANAVPRSAKGGLRRVARKLVTLGMAASLTAVALGGCASTRVSSLTDPETGYGTPEDELKLIRRANDAYEEFERQGLILENPELQSYIEDVASRLIPGDLPHQLKFRFRVLRVPTINAFAAANGDIFLHAGLLAHLENEAQLAHVIAHEISHTWKRHQLAGLRDYQNKTVVAKVVGVGLAALDGGGLSGLLVQLSHAAAVNGYGRELEQEADLEGLRLMASTGYAIEEAPQTYERLNEVEEPGGVAAFFYSSHPSNRARAKYTRRLIDDGTIARSPAERTGAEEFAAATRDVFIENVRLRVRARHYEFALREADSALAKYGDLALIYCYMGDAHLRIVEDPEGAAREQAARERSTRIKDRLAAIEAKAPEHLSAAIAAYQRAAELNPTLARAHRGLGLSAYRSGDGATARRELRLYLDSESRLRDRRYVERILQELNQ